MYIKNGAIRFMGVSLVLFTGCVVSDSYQYHGPAGIGGVGQITFFKVCTSAKRQLGDRCPSTFLSDIRFKTLLVVGDLRI